MKKYNKHRFITRYWLNSMKERGCTLVETKQTIQVRTDEGRHIVAETHLSGPELSLINMVQKDVEKWYEVNKDKFAVLNISNKKVEYKGLHLNTLKRNFDSTVHCFDLKSAYPTFMYNEKMISQRQWDKLQEVSKERKLWIVGAIASTKYITTFKDGIETAYEMKVKETKIVWYYIVYHVDRLMRKLFSEFKSFYSYKYFSLAYYVDCLFILCDSPQVMEEFLKEFSDMVFKAGFSYGYSRLKLVNFDMFNKKIQLSNGEISKTYCLTDNGYFNNGKLIQGV